jgi:hypothetical protein
MEVSIGSVSSRRSRVVGGRWQIRHSPPDAARTRVSRKGQASRWRNLRSRSNRLKRQQMALSTRGRAGGRTDYILVAMLKATDNGVGFSAARRWIGEAGCSDAVSAPRGTYTLPSRRSCRRRPAARCSMPRDNKIVRSHRGQDNLVAARRPCAGTGSRPCRGWPDQARDIRPVVRCSWRPTLSWHRAAAGPPHCSERSRLWRPAARCPRR